MIWGVDVHMTYEAGLNIESLASEGYSFCIVKATEGINEYWAPYGFESWQNRIIQAGMINGAYHWCTPEDPVLQVQHFLARLGDHKAFPIIQLDIGTTTPQNVVDRWMAEWNKQTGNHPVFQYPEKPTSLLFTDLARLGPIWDSHYVDGAGYASVLYEQVPDSWWRPGVRILQFSSKVNAGGLTDVDGDVFHGNKSDLMALATGDNTVTFQPGTPPTDQEIADWWNWFFRGTAAFGDVVPEQAEWHGPKMWKETHDAALFAAGVLKAGIPVTLTVDQMNQLIEGVFTLFKDQMSK